MLFNSIPSQKNILVMKNFPLFILVTLLLAGGCSKKSADTPRVMVPERLAFKTGSQAVTVGNMIILSLSYYNNFGDSTVTPSGIVWTSNDPSVATVNQQGTVTGVAAGQAEIKAVFNNAMSTALVTVVATAAQTATVEIIPMLKELKLNETSALTAVAKDINGNVLSGKTFTWQTDNASFAGIDAATGMVTATGYGTANVRASTDGISSSPAMVQVIRSGAFAQSASTGMAKLKIENGVLKLQTTNDFSVVTGPPDLRIYLGNNSNNVTGAYEVASLNIRSGMQSWNLPASVSITQYKYVIIWCRQFGGVYGLADLGN